MNQITKRIGSSYSEPKIDLNQTIEIKKVLIIKEKRSIKTMKLKLSKYLQKVRVRKSFVQ